MSGEFINRDVSDLAFVQRVLEAAENVSNPVLERARFLAITGMLLDEFYRIRVAALREQIRSRDAAPSIDGLKPAKQLKRADKYSNRLILRQDRCWRRLRRDLKGAGIEIIGLGAADRDERAWLATFFATRLAPIIKPTTEIADVLATIRDGELLLLAELSGGGESQALHAIVPIPPDVPRFVALPGTRQRFMPIEEIIRAFLSEVFPERMVAASGLARIIREGTLRRFDGDDLLRMVREAIKRRETADVIRLRVDRTMPERLTRALAAALGLLQAEDIKALEKSRRRATASEFVVADSFFGLPDLMQLIEQLPEEVAVPLQFPQLLPLRPRFLDEFEDDLFRAIAARERLLHFPYDDFGVVVKLLEQAASDDAVTGIRQTLYRAGADSPIVRALGEAARRGKTVSVVVELEAREDEVENIALAEFLESSGASVSYGLPEHKVHAKLLLIDRLEDGALKRYVHCSTGNYQVSSGNRYTDLCLLSSEEHLALETAQLFDYVRCGALPTSDRRVAVAPLGLRDRLKQLIDAEIRNAQSGLPAGIWMKLNKLSDPELIRSLYRASAAGVGVRLIVRGLCCLRPGVAGLSENIEVKSVVGRYLEHSRAMCFANGRMLPSDSAAVFITSADLMPHKLDRRVEALISIDDVRLKRQIQDAVFEPYFRDVANTWTLSSDEGWSRRAVTGYDVQRTLSARRERAEETARRD